LQKEGPKWQEKLIAYDKTVDSYIEEFWCELEEVHIASYNVALGDRKSRWSAFSYVC
jgi:predicted RNA-binding protein with PIN domain